METKQARHTAGPWYVGNHLEREAAYVIQSEQSGSPIGTVNAGYGVWDANARLIAAAPELLAACRALIENMHRSLVEQRDALEIARAAIAKATQG